jgi:hypothetical protein
VLNKEPQLAVMFLLSVKTALKTVAHDNVSILPALNSCAG